MKLTYFGTRPANVGDIRCTFAFVSDSTIPKYSVQNTYSMGISLIQIMMENMVSSTADAHSTKISNFWKSMSCPIK